MTQLKTRNSTDTALKERKEYDDIDIVLHYIPKRLMLAYEMGEPVRALCGDMEVPEVQVRLNNSHIVQNRKKNRTETCSKCEAIYSRLRP